MSCTFWLKRRKKAAAAKLEANVVEQIVDGTAVNTAEKPVVEETKQKKSAKKAVTNDDNA